MKNRFLLPILFLFINIQLFAQDTLVVQTLTYDSETRSGVFEFPDDPDASYRKIIMEYSMRCLNGQVNPGNNSTGCHEWDYSCNTFITDSTKVDSTWATHPSHIISNFGETTFPYTSQPTYTHYQYTQQEVVYNSIVSENTFDSGAGAEDLSHPLSSTALVSKTQYLWTAAELTGIGLTAGDITSLRMDVNTLGTGLDFLRIKMKATATATLDGANPDLSGFTDVYFLNTSPAAGNNDFNFHTPFNWDGSSNIIVEFSHNNPAAGTDNIIKGEDAGFNAGLVGNTPDYYIVFNGSGHIEVPNDNFPSISNEITISFWAYGDENTLPVNTTIFEGRDDSDNRQANVHLPWGNGRIYWDCGNDGSGYDRIDKEATAAEYAGQWNHWAFTKNAATGSMKIYLNGTLWHSGTGKTRPIDLTALNIGTDRNVGNKYYGNVNDFSIWDKELSAATIQAWMRKDIDATHPDYANLVSYYKLDGDSDQTAVDSSPNPADATFVGYPLRRLTKGEDIFRNLSTTTLRPNITFVRGTYDQSIQSNDVIVSEINSPYSVTEYYVSNNDLFEDATSYLWEAGDEDTYDENGNLISSTPIAAEGTINISTLDYYIKRPGKYEIMSFVTPYGFGLDLGPNGKTWAFDVTDFKPILQGSKYLSMELGGQYNEEMDIRFLFISGTPPRDVKSIQNIWPFARGYYNPITENTIFEERTVQVPSEGSQYKIRTTITGHGQNGEFTPRTHFINLNGGANDYTFQVWKECGENPVYPQGGTWIFDRAGWCPGMATDLREFEITPSVANGEFTIDYGVQPVADQSATNYLVSHQLVAYGEPNFSLDAELIAIKRPSNQIEYARVNSACNNPVVIIKNVGSSTLTSLDISYSIDGGDPLMYSWAGSLAFLESTEVTLPTPDYSFWEYPNGEKTFTANLSNPNGAADENPDNDSAQSTFLVTDKYEGTITFNYRTNNRASQNQFRIKDHAGNIVVERTNMTNATTYNDDLTLMPGCYTLEFTDTGDDGLDFWYWAAVGINVGTGYFRIVQNGSVIKTFEPDFGSDITYDFFVDETVSNQDLSHHRGVGTYPNPTSDDITIELNGWEGEDIQIEVIDIAGKRLHQQNATVVSNREMFNVSLSDFPNGIYLVKIDNGKTVTTSRIVKQL